MTDIMQKHIDLFNMYLNAFKLPIPSETELEKCSDTLAEYKPTRDGTSYTEIPKAVANCLLTVFLMKNEISAVLRQQLKENLRRVKDELDKSQTTSPRKVIAQLFERPDPPDEIKDKMSKIISLEDLVWKSYRQILVESGISENFQIAVGIRKTHNNEYLILGLPADMVDDEDNEETGSPEQGKQLATLIGDALEQIIGEDSRDVKKTSSDTKASASHEISSLEELEKQCGLGIGSIDDSPKPA